MGFGGRDGDPMTLLLMFLGLLTLVLINVPIAVSLGIVALSGMMLSSGMASLPNAALVLFDGSTKFPLIAIPLFISVSSFSVF